MIDRMPPHSIEIEQAVLVSVLIDPGSHDSIFDSLTPDDFYRTAHQKIYKTCLEQYREKKPVELVTIVEALRDRNLLEEVGGASYLASLPDNSPLATNVPARSAADLLPLSEPPETSLSSATSPNTA